MELKAAEAGREREQLMVVAAERRGTVRALEQNLLQEQVRLDSVSKAERIRQIALIEDRYRCPSPCTHTDRAPGKIDL